MSRKLIVVSADELAQLGQKLEALFGQNADGGADRGITPQLYAGVRLIFGGS